MAKNELGEWLAKAKGDMGGDVPDTDSGDDDAQDNADDNGEGAAQQDDDEKDTDTIPGTNPFQKGPFPPPKEPQQAGGNAPGQQTPPPVAPPPRAPAIPQAAPHAPMGGQDGQAPQEGQGGQQAAAPVKKKPKPFPPQAGQQAAPPSAQVGPPSPPAQKDGDPPQQPMAKGGPGSGIKGHTTSGKPIWGHPHHPGHTGFTAQDHVDAAGLHAATLAKLHSDYKDTLAPPHAVSDAQAGIANHMKFAERIEPTAHLPIQDAHRRLTDMMATASKNTAAQGRTRSGKVIYPNADSPGHTGFTAADHSDAAAHHGALASAAQKTALAGNSLSADNAYNHHSTQQALHVIAGQNKNKEKSMATKDNELGDWLVKAGGSLASTVGDVPTGGGSNPADDLPSGTPAMVQSQDVNGTLSQAGAEGGNVDDPGAGSGATLKPTRPGGAQNTLEDTVGSVDSGKNESLGEEDEAGKMPSGAPGIIAESMAGMGKNDRIDKANLDQFHSMPYARYQEDRERAAANWNAQRPDDVVVGFGKSLPPAAAEPLPEVTVKSIGGVIYTDASDLAVSRLLEKSDPHYGMGGSAPTLGDVGPILQKAACGSCKSVMPAYLSKCPECGAPAGAPAQDQPQQVQKSAGRVGYLQPRSPDADLFLPDGVNLPTD